MIVLSGSDRSQSLSSNDDIFCIFLLGMEISMVLRFLILEFS